MRDEIITAMASDLNIKKFHTESNTEYVQRVLYSAMACWIKAIALDRNISEAGTSSGISKKHIYEKSTHILSTMLERFPEARYWFYLDDAREDPIHLIRRRLMQNGDLLPIGFETNISLSPKLTHPVCPGTEHINGMFFDNSVFYSGVSVLRKSSNLEGTTIEKTAVDWFDEYCESAWWEVGAIKNETAEYFNNQKNVRNNHYCWQKEESEFLQSVRLVRITINKNMYEYYLEKSKNTTFYHHKLDPFIIELNEHRKMMFALRKKSNTPLPAKIIKHKDYAVLNIWAYLPYETISFLEAYAWPSRNISDVLEWILPLCLVEETVKKLDNLGMIVTTEENHG